MGITHFDGLSVFGSGLYTGQKGLEKLVINASGYLQSGKITSGIISYPQLARESVRFEELAAGVKIDKGNVGVSGAVTSISTALSSVTTVVAGLDSIVSGLIGIRSVASGHCIDLYTYTDLGGASNLSTTVRWIAVGN